MFDRFYRTAESRSRESGGTGLGLPIVRDLVRAHGGTVRLTDEPGPGPTTTGTGPGLMAVVTLPTVELTPAGPTGRWAARSTTAAGSNWPASLPR